MLSANLQQNTAIADVTASVHAPAADTDAVVTLSAPGEGLRRVIHSIQYSYSGGAPTGGNLKVETGDGPTTILDVDVTDQGVKSLELTLPGGVNEEVVITLAAGGASVVGKLNVQSSLLAL